MVNIFYDISYISDISVRTLFTFSDILLQCILSCERNKRICLCDDEESYDVSYSSWRRFGYSLMMTAATVARKRKKKCNKEKNLYTMNATSVVSWWVSNGKTNV